MTFELVAEHCLRCFRAWSSTPRVAGGPCPFCGGVGDPPPPPTLIGTEVRHYCEGCGARLLEPARLCGFCEAEL